MSHHNALGGAGGAGGKVHIQRIRIDPASADLCQPVKVRLCLHQFLKGQQLHAGEDPGCFLLQCLSGDHHPGRKHRGNLGQPACRQLIVEHRVKAPCIHGSEKDRQYVRTFFHIHAHRLPRGNDAAQCSTDPGTAQPQLFIGITLAFIDYGIFLWLPCRRSFQIIQHIADHSNVPFHIHNQYSKPVQGVSP